MPSSTSSRKSTATPKRPAAASKAAPAKKAVSKASDFKKKSTIELELPSGNVCLAKRPGMEALLASGVFSDSLMPIVHKSIEAAKRGKVANVDIDEAEIMKNPKLMSEIMQAYDKVVPLVVVEPKVHLHLDSNGNTIPDDERDDDTVYTDDVDLTDKVFIFQWASGGSPDLATFREQLGEGVAALAGQSGVQLPS